MSHNRGKIESTRVADRISRSRRFSDHSVAASKAANAALKGDTEKTDSPTILAVTHKGLPPPYPHDPTELLELAANELHHATRSLSISSDHGNLSLSSGSMSSDTPGVRVRTKGNDLRSGFPYHPRLYDLRVRPDDWQRFSDQVTDAVKFSPGDHAKMWAAAGSVALTGSVLTTAWIGRYAGPFISLEAFQLKIL